MAFRRQMASSDNERTVNEKTEKGKEGIELGKVPRCTEKWEKIGKPNLVF